MAPAPNPWAIRPATSIGMEVAAPPTTRPTENSTRPAVKGTASPRSSASRPETTMPRRLARKNPLNTQP